MIAPIASGAYTNTWQLKHGGTAFGPAMSVRINVVTTPAFPIWQITAGVGGIILVIWGSFWFAFRRRQTKTLRLSDGKAQGKINDV